MNRERIGCPEFRRMLHAERVSRRRPEAGDAGLLAGWPLSGLLRARGGSAAEAGKVTDKRNPSSSSGCAAAPRSMKPGTPSPMHRSNTAANSLPSAPKSPASSSMNISR